MNAPVRIGTAVLVLSVAVWMAIYYTMPPPPSEQDTVVIVGVVAMVVAGTRRFWGWLATPRSGQ